MYATNQFRKGLKVEIDGIPYEIVDFQHVSPGKGRAFTRTKLKNMLNQNVIERTITSGDKLDRANTEEKEMQFLYKDIGGYHFMNNANYEQITLNEEQLGTGKDFLQENLVIKVMYFNERPIGVELPTFVVLKIVETEPSFRGDTVTGGETLQYTGLPFCAAKADAAAAKSMAAIRTPTSMPTTCAGCG